MKYCKRCDSLKPENEFHLSKRHKDGRHQWCKICLVSANKTYNKQKNKLRKEAKQALTDAGLQICSGCKKQLPISKFSKANAYCKLCKSEADKKYQQEKRMAQIKPVKEDAVFPDAMAKRCGKCLEVKSFTHFYKSSSSLDGYQSYCTKCNKAYDKDKQQLLKTKRKIITQSNYNNNGYFEEMRGGERGRPSDAFFALTPERVEFLNQQREHWKQVFAERHNDCIELLKAYEAEPDNSVQLITDFHNNTRPTWTLKHKTLTQSKNDYYGFLREKHATKTTRGDDSGNERN